MTALESPMEWKFARAIASYPDFVERPSMPIGVLIRQRSRLESAPFTYAPQVLACTDSADYRSDFAFVADCPGVGHIALAVEIDGHDFHERTKWQARRDRARDRALLAHGLYVMRFTGSEVHRNAGVCFQEVRNFLIDKRTSAYEDNLLNEYIQQTRESALVATAKEAVVADLVGRLAP